MCVDLPEEEEQQPPAEPPPVVEKVHNHHDHNDADDDEDDGKVLMNYVDVAVSKETMIEIFSLPKIS